MYSLSELEENLKSLIAQLQQMKGQISNPQITKAKNQKTLLLRIPNSLMLLSIFKYLDMHEIKYLSLTCSGLRKRIFSPLGWKIVNRIKTPYPIRIITKKSELRQKIKKIGMESGMQTGFDDFSDEKFITQQRAKSKNKLLSKYTVYLQSKQRYQACNDKVRMEKAHLFRLKQQVAYLQAVRQDLDEQNRVNKQKLKELSEGFSLKMKDMDEMNDNLLKERTKLQNQKQALASKIRQYQHQIEMIRQDSQKSKEILRRLKNYLLYKQL